MRRVTKEDVYNAVNTMDVLDCALLADRLNARLFGDNDEYRPLVAYRAQNCSNVTPVSSIRPFSPIEEGCDFGWDVQWNPRWGLTNLDCGSEQL